MDTNQEHIVAAFNLLTDRELQEIVPVIQDASDRNETLADLYYGAREALDRRLAYRQRPPARRATPATASDIDPSYRSPFHAR